MRNGLLITATLLLFAFISAPDLSATETGDPEVRVVEVIPQVQSAPAAGVDGLDLSTVQIERRVASEETAAAQFAPRGSFWWVVGVIVVAGVILAVLL